MTEQLLAVGGDELARGVDQPVQFAGGDGEAFVDDLVAEVDETLDLVATDEPLAALELLGLEQRSCSFGSAALSPMVRLRSHTLTLMAGCSSSA